MFTKKICLEKNPSQKKLCPEKNFDRKKFSDEKNCRPKNRNRTWKFSIWENRKSQISKNHNFWFWSENFLVQKKSDSVSQIFFRSWKKNGVQLRCRIFRSFYLWRFQCVLSMANRITTVLVPRVWIFFWNVRNPWTIRYGGLPQPS